MYVAWSDIQYENTNERDRNEKEIKWIWIIGRNVYWIFSLYRLLHCRKMCAFMTRNFLYTTQKKLRDKNRRFSSFFWGKLTAYIIDCGRKEKMNGKHFIMKSLNRRMGKCLVLSLLSVSRERRRFVSSCD